MEDTLFDIVVKYIAKILESRVFDFVKLAILYGVLLGFVSGIFGVTFIKWIALVLVLPMCLFITLSIVCIVLSILLDFIGIICSVLFFCLYTLFAYTEYTIFKKYRVFAKKDYMLFWISEDKSV